MLNRISNILSNIKVSLIPIPTKIKLDIPYFSQWESPELVDKILSKIISAKDDPNWKSSGNNTKEEYEYWSWNLCGTTCLKMILLHRTGHTYALFKLAKKITEYGGYIPRNNNIIDGLFYKPFVKYLKYEHNINAQIASPMTLRRIKYELSLGNYVLASVNQNIRDKNNASPKIKSGHLILMTGYDENKRTLSFHNPSGLYQKSQVNHTLNEQDFSRFYSGKGIIIKWKE